MSLLKWKELAKRKTELGNKINYVHNAIKQHKIGEETSQESFGKLFKPVTSKLDDVIDSNLNLRMPPQSRKRPPKKTEPEIDYAPEVDPFEDMDVEGLINSGDYVPPQQEKQIVPKPPTYEESLADILEGKKEIYVDPKELPPEYDDDEEIDYAMDDYVSTNRILDDLNLANYEDVDYNLKQQEMTHKKKGLYLSKIIKDATYKRNQLKGYKSNITKRYNSGQISEAEKQVENKRINDARIV